MKIRQRRIAIMLASVLLLAACTGNSSSSENRQTSGTTPAQLKFASRDDSDFEPLREPLAGDWLASFDEPGQTLEQYQAQNPVRAEGQRQVLVIQPMGRQPMGLFSDQERKVFEAAVELAGIWFDLPTRIEKSLPLPEQGWQRTRQFPWQSKPQTQYQTGYFLDYLLPPRIPDDAVCYLAVTMADLYPDDSWNYVFGQATLLRRVGVYSLVRYFPEFWGQKPDPASDTLALRRSCKVLVHETGHMFGLAHCTKYRCVMNGSNSLEEGDERPVRLCPECLRKLQWNRGFDIIKVYQAEEKFFRARGLTEDAEWLKKRMEKIRSVK